MALSKRSSAQIPEVASNQEAHRNTD